MIGELEYDVARIAYGDIGGTLHCMKKMEASPEDYDYVFFNNQSDIFTKAIGADGLIHEEPINQQQTPQPNQQVPAPFSTGSWNTTGTGVRPSTNVPGIGDVRGQQGDVGFAPRTRAAMRTRGSDVSYQPTTTLLGRTTEGGRDEGAGYSYTDPQTGQVTRVAPGMTDRARDWLGRRGDELREFGRVNLGEEGKRRREQQSQSAQERKTLRQNIRRGTGVMSRLPEFARRHPRLADNQVRDINRIIERDQRQPSLADSVSQSGGDMVPVPPPGGEAPRAEINRPSLDALGRDEDPDKGPSDDSSNLVDEAPTPAPAPEPAPAPAPEPAPETKELGAAVGGEGEPQPRKLYGTEEIWGGEGEQPGFHTPIPGFVGRDFRHAGQKKDRSRVPTPGGMMMQHLTRGGGAFTNPETGKFITSTDPLEQAWNKLRDEPPTDEDGKPLWTTARGKANEEKLPYAPTFRILMRDLSGLLERGADNEYLMTYLRRLSPTLAENREAAHTLISAAYQARQRGLDTSIEEDPNKTPPPPVEDPNKETAPPPIEEDPNKTDFTGATPNVEGPTLGDIIDNLKGSGDDKNASSDPLQSAWDHLSLLKEGDE